MSTAQYGGLSFKEAIAFFRAKLNVPSERWTDIWKEQHNVAFMVAGATKTELLADLRQAVDAAIAQGKSLNWFKSEFKNIVKKNGWDHTGDAAWRARVIYDTNMRQAYNAGRWQQLQQFEFWRYVHGDSRYPRPAHQAKHNLVLPKTAAFWQVWFPQNGWGCKCKVVGETAQSVKRKGYSVSPEPGIAMREWVDRKTGEVHQVPKGIDPGFDYAPGHIKPADAVKAQIDSKPALAERLQPRLVPTAFSTVPGVNVHRLNDKLQELADTSAGPQVQQLSAFIEKHSIKTLFLKQAEMNPKAIAPLKIAADVASYIGRIPGIPQLQAYTINQYLIADGFTASVFNHVVIKAGADQLLSNVVMNEVRRAVDLAIALKQSGKPGFTLSDLIKRHVTHGQDGALFTNWLHELGHLVHFKAGTPMHKSAEWLTTYATQNFKEWHAEHFVMWLLNRKSLAQWNPEIAVYFDQLMEKGLN
ncbi:phage minor head protein [Rheinheimera sp.]|uniref:phage minor head protein n=1 Tax=Rheinheimera sp. TaxID=1869214 RepID=UPI00307DCE30